jgi:hypothetical protein
LCAARLAPGVDDSFAWKRCAARRLAHGLQRRGLVQVEAGLVLGDEDRAHEANRNPFLL